MSHRDPFIESARYRACKGLTAKTEGDRLVITDEAGRQLECGKDYSVGATTDWMSGTFTLRGEVIVQWDRGRRKKPTKHDSWSYWGPALAGLINQYSAKSQGSKTPTATVLDMGTLTVFPAQITDLTTYHGDELICGNLELLGAMHHVRFVKVKDGDIVEPPDDAHNDVKVVFKDMQRLNEGAFHRVTLPGRPAKYVMVIFPFAD